MKKHHLVLLVDDDSGWLGTHEDILSGHNLNILTARNGWQALLLLECNPVDLVVLDSHMPRLDGVELLKILRNSYPHIPVIMCLSHADGKVVSAEDVLRVGATAVLEKSEDPTQLLPLISVLLIIHDLRASEGSQGQ